MSDVKYVISVDAATGIATIQKLDDEWTRLNKTEEKSIEQKEKLSKSSTGLWQDFVKGALVVEALRKTWHALVGVGTASIKNAIEAEKAEMALGAAIETSGRRLSSYLPSLNEHAQAMQRLTTSDDEAVRGAQALLIQLTDLDLRGIKRATEGAIGLAAVFGMDLQSASTLVAKAMTGNMAALSRYGIKIDETLPLQEKQNALLARLAPFFERAKAEVNTFGGALDQLKNTWNEALEATGAAVVKNEEVVKIIRLIDKEIRELAASGNLQRWAADLAKVFVQSFKIIGLAVEGVLLLFPSVMAGIYAIDHAFYSAIGHILEGLSNVPGVGAQIGVGLKVWADDLAKFADTYAAAADVQVEKASNIVAAFDEYEKMANLVIAGLDAVAKGQVKGAESAHVAKAAWTPLGDIFKTTGKEAKESSESIYLTALMMSLAAKSNEEFTATMKDAEEELKRIAAAAAKSGSELKVMTRSDISAKIDEMAAYLERFRRALPADEVRRLRQEIEELKARLAGTNDFDGLIDGVQKFALIANAAISGMNTIFAQAQRNKEIAIDNEYKKRLKVINATIKDEAARQKATMALEAEYQIKKTEAQRAGARAQKAVALMSATVNTAQAITSALAMFPPNLILAAIVGALGAVQIGMIAKQPIPLASGAVFTRATTLTSSHGATYQMGEGGEDEILAPESKLRSIFRDVFSTTGSLALAGGMTININSPLIQTSNLSRADIEQASAQLFDSIEREMRRRGRR